MKLLPYILDRIAFVQVELLPEDELRTSVRVWRRGVMEDGSAETAGGCLSAVVICGQGVIAKPDDSEIAARVKADPTTFICSSAAGQTSFVRRDRAQAALDYSTAHHIVPVCLFCAESSADFEAAADEYVRQVYAGLSPKTLLRPAPESSAVLQILVRRAALPVLGVFLLLLAVNAVVAPKLNARRQTLRTELTVRGQASAGEASAGARQRELIARFAVRPELPHAVLCDRIAVAVPERVVLTSLEIEPLAKRFEVGKPLVRRENLLTVCGTAPTAADISLFVQGLSDSGCCNGVRLANVEKQRDNDALVFRIEAAI